MVNKRGFTLIELIMVIVILGILAVVAIPRYFNLQKQAREAAVDGVVGGVRGGIHTYFAENTSWPATVGLEEATDDATLVFEGVLEQGVPVTEGWSRAIDVYTYTFPGALPDGGTEIYTYYPTTVGTVRAGTFKKTGGTHTR